MATKLDVFKAKLLSVLESGMAIQLEKDLSTRDKTIIIEMASFVFRTILPPCLTNSAADEPIFVLRAQDETAVKLVAIWMQENAINAPEKLESAAQVYRNMYNWPYKKRAD